MLKSELYQGDCLDLMPNIPSGSIDMILADPPYGTTACKWDSIIPLDRMWEQLKRIIKHNGAIVLFAQTPFDKVLGASNLPMSRYEWIWEKGNATGFLNAHRAPLKAHENILVFYSKEPTYNPQKTKGHQRKVAKRHSQKSECYNKNFKTSEYDSTERYPRSVLKFSSDKQLGNYHPTQKPVKLMKYLTKTYTKPGETVLDFCMGGGTTGVACRDLDRDFIGMELDPVHFKTSKDRIYKMEAPKPSVTLFD